MDEPIYTVTMAARLLNLGPQRLRTLEAEGIILPPVHHSPGGWRRYTSEEIEDIRRILRARHGK